MVENMALFDAAELYNMTCDMIEENDSNVDIIESNLSTCLDTLQPIMEMCNTNGYCKKRRRKAESNEFSEEIQNVRHLLSRCQVLLGQLIEWKDPTRAQDFYRSAIDIDSSYVEAHTQLARALWQQATMCNQENMRESESLLRQAISIGVAADAVDSEDVVEAKRLLIRLLWQFSNGERRRIHEAHELLNSLGYDSILAHELFDPAALHSSLLQKRENTTSSKRILNQRASVYDCVLPLDMLNYLKHAFGETSPFWPCHGYNSPTTGFFSYQNRLSSRYAAIARGKDMYQEGTSELSSFNIVIHYMWSVASQNMPSLSKAKYAEWWAHKRYHTNGHKIHFDYISDPKNPSIPKHPIATCIIYLTDTCGGSTLITDQTVVSGVANEGYLVEPRVNRMVCFDGRLLHTVLPGAGMPTAPSDRRITLMVAFYETDPSAPDYLTLESDIKNELPKKPNEKPMLKSGYNFTGSSSLLRAHSSSLEWVKYFNCPLICNSITASTVHIVNDAGLIHLNRIVEPVSISIEDQRNAESSIDRTLSKKKQSKKIDKTVLKRSIEKRAGVDLLQRHKIFTYFEALNSGLVLAKKYI